MIDDPSEAARNPDRASGEEPMTEAQAAYLRALCADTGADFDPGLSRDAAAERIEQLKALDPSLSAGSDNPDMS